MNQEYWTPVNAGNMPDAAEGPFIVTNNPGATNSRGRPTHVWVVDMLHANDDPDHDNYHIRGGSGAVFAFTENWSEICNIKAYRPVDNPEIEG